ncbi:MAG: hypothetical protein MRY63_11525 [Neomegalonema sp.]|nr:hypothetical protein [Neomegalonema sp.]
MKTLMIALTCSALASAATGLVVYGQAKQQWQAQGHRAGMVAGSERILRELDSLATKGRPPRAPDLAIDFQDLRLSILRDENNLQIYSE